MKFSRKVEGEQRVETAAGHDDLAVFGALRIVDEGLLGTDIEVEGLTLPGLKITQSTAQAAVCAQLTARIQLQRHQPGRQAVFEVHVEHGFVTAGVAQLVAQQKNVVGRNGLALHLLPGADFWRTQVGQLDRLG